MEKKLLEFPAPESRLAWGRLENPLHEEVDKQVGWGRFSIDEMFYQEMWSSAQVFRVIREEFGHDHE